MTKRIDWPDLLLGLFLILVASVTLFATRKLSIGIASDMGPGYVPRAVSFGLIGFGLFFLMRGFLSAWQGIAAVQLRPLVCIAVSVAVFALLAERAGLVLAALACIISAAIATKEVRPLEAVLFGCVMAGLSVLLFVKVLALPVPVWPPGLFD
jgi:hypothetical protein